MKKNSLVLLLEFLAYITGNAKLKNIDKVNPDEPRLKNLRA
jgi:hypothetical protein